MKQICGSVLVAAALMHAQKIDIELDPAADFSKFRTFRLRDGQINSIIVDLRDPTKRELVWRGIAVQDKDRPADLEGKLDDMVRKTIDKYPPKK